MNGLIGFGVSCLFGFSRYRWPVVPKWLASSGLAIGSGLLVLSILPNPFRLGPAVLLLFSFILAGIAIEWQLSAKSASQDVGVDPKPDRVDPMHSETAIPITLSEPAKAPLAHGQDSYVTQSQGFRPNTDGQAPVAVVNSDQERIAILQNISQQYIFDHDNIPAPMLAGRELAPVEYLNDELQRMGTGWRVRQVNGLNAEFYEVQQQEP